MHRYGRGWAGQNPGLRIETWGTRQDVSIVATRPLV